jgi:site-specific DNA recombinase
MKIAALYARVSTAKQQLNENIASQIAALKDYAMRHDYQISPQEIYQDDGYSGATLDRPALDRLRDAVAQGRIEAVIILSPDRLARQFAYQYIVVEEFERAGCKVVFINHRFGSSPAERMLQEMTGVFAEYERALITERCRRGRLHKARSGKVVISVAPYGYTYIPRSEHCPGNLLVNDAEAEVVRQIFQWLIDEQFSVSEITGRLNESGLRTRRGNKWQRGTVINLLRNAVYAGTYYYNRRRTVPAKQQNRSRLGSPRKHHISAALRPEDEWIAVQVTPIIDQETWDAARHQLKLNQERAGRNNKKRDYLLKGLLVCGCCNLRMRGTTRDAVRPQRRYACSRYGALPETDSAHCSNRVISADIIEKIVWQSITELLCDPDLLMTQYRQQQELGFGASQQSEQLRLERRLSVLRSEIQRLIDAYQTGVIELDELAERRLQLADECARMEMQIGRLRQLEQEQQRQIDLSVTVEAFCRNISTALDNPSFETKQKILRLMVERIDFVDDQITIRHVIPVSAGPPADRQLRRNRLHKNPDTFRKSLAIADSVLQFAFPYLLPHAAPPILQGAIAGHALARRFCVQEARH